MIAAKLRRVGNIPGPGKSRIGATVIELTVDFQVSELEDPRKILLDVVALRELSDRAQERKSRPFSSSTVAAGARVGVSTETVVRRWLGRG